MGLLVPTGMVSKAEGDFQEARPTLFGRNQRFVREGSGGRRARTTAMHLAPAAALNIPALALRKAKIKGPRWIGNQTSGMSMASAPIAALGLRGAKNRNIKRGDVAVVNPYSQQQARRYTIFGRQEF